MSVGELVKVGVLERPIDGNHGEIHPKTEDFVEEGVPFVMASDLKNGRVDYEYCARISERQAEGLRKGFARNGDVLLTHKATIGQTAIVDYGLHPYIVLTPQVTYYRVRDRKRLNNRYLKYYFESSLLQQTLQMLASSGSTRAYLGITEQHRLPVVLPPIEKQRKIAAILSAYDDLIANNQRRIALLESMAEEIYREWFVRMRCLISSAGNLSTKLFQPFDSLCELQRGFDLPDRDMAPGDVPVIASTSVKGFHNLARVKPPVVTTGRSGSLGTVLFTHVAAWPLNTVLYVKNFRGNSAWFVYYTLKSLRLENFNAGAGVPTLNRNHLAGIKVRIPPPDVQERFQSIVSPMLEAAEKLRQSSKRLGATRDALLPRLISGKLKVDHLDIHFPPAMHEEAEHAPS